MKRPGNGFKVLLDMGAATSAVDSFKLKPSAGMLTFGSISLNYGALSRWLTP